MDKPFKDRHYKPPAHPAAPPLPQGPLWQTLQTKIFTPAGLLVGPQQTLQCLLEYLHPMLLKFFGDDYLERLHGSAATDPARDNIGRLLTKASYRLLINKERTLGLRVLSYMEPDRSEHRHMAGYAPTSLEQIVAEYPGHTTAGLQEFIALCQNAGLAVRVLRRENAKDSVILATGMPSLENTYHDCVVELVFSSADHTIFRKTTLYGS